MRNLAAEFGGRRPPRSGGLRRRRVARRGARGAFFCLRLSGSSRTTGTSRSRRSLGAGPRRARAGRADDRDRRLGRRLVRAAILGRDGRRRTHPARGSAAAAPLRPEPTDAKERQTSRSRPGGGGRFRATAARCRSRQQLSPEFIGSSQAQAGYVAAYRRGDWRAAGRRRAHALRQPDSTPPELGSLGEILRDYQRAGVALAGGAGGAKARRHPRRRDGPRENRPDARVPPAARRGTARR